MSISAVTREIGLHPDCCLILLHGLGTNGNDMLPLSGALSLSPALHLRCIFPHAPFLPVTLNGGIVMSAWYDVYDLQSNKGFDRVQLEMSAAALHDLVEEEIGKGLDSRRIVVGGFSQGGAVAYHFALGYERPLAGLLAMSTWWLTAKYCDVHSANASLPILVQHGVNDPVIVERHGAASVTALQKRGFQPEYLTYPVGHRVCAEQITDISRWLQACLGGERKEKD